MTGSSSQGFWAMVVLASLLLVVVCVNVAILIYARTVSRLGEIAVRTALGASRRRIVAQLFAESFVLSAAAAAAGIAVVQTALDWMRKTVTVTGDANFWDDYTLSGTGVLYAVALVLMASIITGVIPAFRATGRKVQADLRQVSRGSSELRMGRTWTSLIVVQVSVAAVAVPMAVSLGAFQIRDYFRVPRFDTEQFLFARARTRPAAVHAIAGHAEGRTGPPARLGARRDRPRVHERPARHGQRGGDHVRERWRGCGQSHRVRVGRR